MHRKIISSLVFVSFLNLIGCYSYQTISKEELNKAEEYRDLQVITKDQRTYEFDKGNYTFTEDSIYGSGKLKIKDDQRVNKNYEGSIYFEDIKKLKMDGFDLVTTILVIAIPVALVAIAAASFSPLEGEGSILK
jgi:hypothetical protein